MTSWIRASAFLALSLVASSVPCRASVRQLTFPPSNHQDLMPLFSPRGDKVAFARWTAGDPLPAIFVVDLASGIEDTLLTGLPTTWSHDRGVAWSPDGSQFVYWDAATNGFWIADVPSPPPSPLPHLVAVVEGSKQTCVAQWAIDDRGTLYEDCGVDGSWFIAGHVAGTPVHMTVQASPRNLLVTMANGDVWAASVGGPQPYTFTLLSNVFAAAGITGVEPSVAPRAVGSLERARPNPFNPSTRVPYVLATAGLVTARVYDAAGRLVRTLEHGQRAAGDHVATWDGRDASGRAAASGTYFLRVEFPSGDVAERKVTLLK